MEDRHVVMPTMSVVCPANKVLSFFIQSSFMFDFRSIIRLPYSLHLMDTMATRLLPTRLLICTNAFNITSAKRNVGLGWSCSRNRSICLIGDCCFAARRRISRAVPLHVVC